MDGLKLEHTLGRSGDPNILHKLFSESCMQRTPAGFPCGIPGIAEDMEGAIQQAPQPSLHSIVSSILLLIL